MENNDNIFAKILHGIGVCCLYLLGLVLVLSSGCFVFFGIGLGMNSNAVSLFTMLPIGIALGIAAYFLIRYIFRMGKEKKNPQ